MRPHSANRVVTYRIWAALGIAGFLANDIARGDWVFTGVMIVVLAYLGYLFSLDFAEWKERRKHPHGFAMVVCTACGWQHQADADDPETPLIVNAHYVMCEGDKPTGGML